MSIKKIIKNTENLMNFIFKNFVTDTNIIIIPSFYLYMYFIYHLKFIKFHFFNSVCKN